MQKIQNFKVSKGSVVSSRAFTRGTCGRHRAGDRCMGGGGGSRHRRVKGQCSPTSAGPGVRQETGTVPAVRVHHKELMCTPVRGPSLRNEHRTPRWRDNLNEISINGTVCAGAQRLMASARSTTAPASVIRSGANRLPFKGGRVPFG